MNIETIILLTGFLFLMIICVHYRPQPHKVKSYTIEQFMNTISLRGSSFSADEKSIVFSSNESGIYNAYAIPITGGTPQPLTHSKDNSIFIISFFPEDNRLLFRSDQGGNEIWHIYLREENGTIKNLTPDENARSAFFSWSRDNQSFFYESNKRDSRCMDLYQMDLKTFTSKMIFQNDDGYSLRAISKHNNYLALYKKLSNHNSEMYLCNLSTQALQHLTPHVGDINYRPQNFSLDSKYLYFLTDEEREFSYLKRYHLETGQFETVQVTSWDISYSYFSYNEKYRVVAINNDARTEIQIYDTAKNKPISLPDLPLGCIQSVHISKSEKLMTFYHNGSKSPNNLYIYNFETKVCQKLTETMNPEIDAADLVEAEVVRYQSFDALEIPALLYKPHQIHPDDKAPALIWVHGGPGGQSLIHYHPLIQFLVNHGYVLIAVNNRGSSGYGKTFFKLDDLKHGQDDLDDCVAAKDFLIATGYVDKNRIGIIGGSYGGYMVLAGLAFRPEAFAVGIDIFGVANWVRTLKSIPPWWTAFKNALYQEIGNPETDEEYLKGISPFFHADKINKPLIVLQGANDPRVLKVESDEIVAAVINNGVPVEYIVFDDEGHGFVKRENEIEGYEAILKFLDRYLKHLQ